MSSRFIQLRRRSALTAAMSGVLVAFSAVLLGTVLLVVPARRPVLVDVLLLATLAILSATIIRVLMRRFASLPTDRIETEERGVF